MQQVTERTKNYKEILKCQEIILKELDQLKTKMLFLGSLGRLKEVAKKGRQFAKKQKISPKDVLEND